MSYRDGYYDGQADALAWLAGDVGVDDDCMAPVHHELSTDYSLWCLGLNLAMVGALATAERNGRQAGFEWRRQYNRNSNYGYQMYERK